jgi:hypothetical protein
MNGNKRKALWDTFFGGLINYLDHKWHHQCMVALNNISQHAELIITSSFLYLCSRFYNRSVFNTP